MGRPAIPISIHKSRGTYRTTRHAGIPEVHAGPIGDAPSWFQDEARSEWDRIKADPIRCLAVNSSHRAIVEHHCILYERFVQDAKGERLMTASERQTFHSIQMQLGWTPVTQAKLGAPKKSGAESPWEDL